MPCELVTQTEGLLLTARGWPHTSHFAEAAEEATCSGSPLHPDLERTLPKAQDAP